MFKDGPCSSFKAVPILAPAAVGLVGKRASEPDWNVAVVQALRRIWKTTHQEQVGRCRFGEKRRELVADVLVILPEKLPLAGSERLAKLKAKWDQIDDANCFNGLAGRCADKKSPILIDPFSRGIRIAAKGGRANAELLPECFGKRAVRLEATA